MQARGIITIDGPAGSGKSTVGRLLAAALGYLYLDSGALYRLVAWQADRLHLDLADAQALNAFLAGLQPEMASDDQGFHLWVDGREVTPLLREPRVTQQSSRVAVLPRVRSWVSAKLRYWARNGGVVAEGRDLGTVVFPQAEVKFYLDAALETRAARRGLDWQKEEAPLSPEKVVQELADRDRRDANRAASPMRAAAEALVIDTTDLSPPEVVRRCLARIREVLPECGGPDVKLEMKTG
ncbi:MAG: (d)CMP kinase [Thermodesulfobacteriota bacterium]